MKPRRAEGVLCRHCLAPVRHDGHGGLLEDDTNVPHRCGAQLVPMGGTQVIPDSTERASGNAADLALSAPAPSEEAAPGADGGLDIEGVPI